MAKRTDWTGAFSDELTQGSPEPVERKLAPAEVVPMETTHERGEASRLLEVLQAGGDVDLYLARHRPRRVTSVPATYRIPLDLAQILKEWVAKDPEHRTSTGLIVALLDAWARDAGHKVER